jgi:hypothetical protein
MRPRLPSGRPPAPTTTTRSRPVPLVAKKPTPNLTLMATRLPHEVYKAVKIHCVEDGISMMSFVTEALIEKLKKASK